MSDLKERFQNRGTEEIDLPEGHKERFLNKMPKESKRNLTVWQVAAGLIIVIASSILY